MRVDDVAGNICQPLLGGGKYQVAEVMGGAVAPPADGGLMPILRCFDSRNYLVERQHTLSVVSNSTPNQLEWVGPHKYCSPRHPPYHTSSFLEINGIM